MATTSLTDQTPSDFMIFAVAVPTSKTWDDETRASWWNILFWFNTIHPDAAGIFWNRLLMIVVRCVRPLANIISHRWNHHMKSHFYCKACKWKRNLTSLLAGFSRWNAAFCRSWGDFALLDAYRGSDTLTPSLLARLSGLGRRVRSQG